MPFKVVFDDVAVDEFRRLRKYDQTTIADHIAKFLTTSPTVESPPRIVELGQPAVSQFRLRVADYRVYYNVDEGEQTVNIMRVVEKGTKTTAEVTKDASN